MVALYEWARVGPAICSLYVSPPVASKVCAPTGCHDAPNRRPTRQGSQELRTTIFALAAVAVIAGCGDGPEGSDPHPPNSMKTVVVTWIDDGDSLDATVEGADLSIRLLGINAPELGECFADVSLDYLIENVKAKEVGYVPFGTDQFGRTLAEIWVDGQLLNLELVARGLAVATTPDGLSAHGTDLLAAEDAAYVRRLGLWAETACGASGTLPPIEFDWASSQPNPPGPDSDDLDAEYVTIFNTGGASVDLSGWTLRDESSRNRLVFPSGLILD
ncbi:MAG: thermonuclease family protein, partial [Acidimicrobiia bacterium]|nr:thermonuclease family protein [Acidimicrobiia bacterium]